MSRHSLSTAIVNQMDYRKKCSWCQRKYVPGDDVIDRMEYNAEEGYYSDWCGESIHRYCDYDRSDHESKKNKQTAGNSETETSDDNSETETSN